MQVMWWIPSSSIVPRFVSVRARSRTTHLDKVVKARGETCSLELLPEALDRVGVADVDGVGVAPGVAGRAPLAEQVPAAVELDLDVAQALLIGLERVVVRRVGLLAGAKRVLLGDQTFDPCGDGFVAHVLKPTPVGWSRLWFTTSMLLPSGSNTNAA